MKKNVLVISTIKVKELILWPIFYQGAKASGLMLNDFFSSSNYLIL
ncbi:MAG: hypothetical protein ACLUIS_07260 [Longibaculum sp.]